EQLVGLGHQVTLFASGDSITSAELVSCSPIALRLAASPVDPLAYQATQHELLRQRIGDFDIVHLHDGFTAFSLMREL
ncbi:glycosyltransferase family 4 protein, partial [Gulbenkiania mobilis]|uniref:glycosyltransferase family 4 protein n=1 Tax=Gulbenkiania mobilis TaxID=397457 RepID=UPI00137919E0